jgi:hypothetical protein
MLRASGADSFSFPKLSSPDLPLVKLAGPSRSWAPCPSAPRRRRGLPSDPVCWSLAFPALLLDLAAFQVRVYEVVLRSQTPGLSGVLSLDLPDLRLSFRDISSIQPKLPEVFSKQAIRPCVRSRNPHPSVRHDDRSLFRISSLGVFQRSPPSTSRCASGPGSSPR